jgi:endothelin-converting enzyme/putative endopeptidase
MLEPRDGLTPEQRILPGNAQWTCANERPEFAKAFSCKAGQPTATENVCRIW